MIKTIIFDFSRVLLFAKNKGYKEDLNPLHKKLLEQNQNYNFFDFFELNEKLLEFLEAIRDKFELYIFTSGSIQNAKEIKSRLDEVFKDVFSAEELNLSKKDPQAYIVLTKKLDKNPKEVIFIDDSQTNIEAASQAGLNVFQYSDNESLIKEINQLLSDN